MLRLNAVLLATALLVLPATGLCENTGALPRCEAVPLPERQISLRVEGEERVRWHFGAAYERPFFYPFRGPNGSALTRMGHPGAPNHDHHRSVWFAHQNVEGTDFWSNTGAGRIRQEHWYCYRDGEDEAVMAVRLGWYDGEGNRVMESDAIAALRPLGEGESLVEIQLTCRTPEGRQSVTLGKTNFGILAVRVAKSLSVHFGGGVLSDSEGRSGEEAIFGERARWVDYSGPVAVGTGLERSSAMQGITYFGHPGNPNYPSRWHVRADGWMGASLCMDDAKRIEQGHPLTLRYALHAHAGAYNAERASAIARAFVQRAPFEISKSAAPHQQFDVQRARPVVEAVVE